ncbi:TPA: hypothetical protein ACQ3YX_001067 [Pseudomonas aeruginosa]
MTNLVRECFGYQFPDILSKPQVSYIYNYLKRMGAKSVLLEFDYIDKDFLEDFTRYYAKRYKNDGHHCARMHFFANTIDHRCITSVLDGGLEAEGIADQLQSAYLGFMVIKPLPKTFIGKTCLKVMSDKVEFPARKRRMWRTYDVDLFGIKLSVDSIAFQEQDKVVAACATTAIWSALHALRWRSVRSIRSCSEITMSALNDGDGSSNSFPNTGLSSEQILRSIDAEGLRHHMESMLKVDQSRFFSSVIGHIDSQLPLIFVGDVFGVEEERRAHKGILEYRGSHAICILGYKVDKENVVYIHDDRYGPYARAKLVSTKDYTSDRPLNREWALGIQSMSEDGTWSEPKELIIPDVLIVPTDKKTRLPFDYARETCETIVLALSLSSGHKLAPDDLSFRIQLREISDIRQEVRRARLPCDVSVEGDGGLSMSEEKKQTWRKLRVEFLTSGFARFQWVAQFFHKGSPAFKVLIDATDIPQGDAVTAILVDDVPIAAPYLLHFIDHAQLFKSEQRGQFFQSFLRRLTEDDESIETYLNKTYGEVRAPLYLKGAEFKGGGGEIFRSPTAKPLYDAPGVKVAKLHKEFSKRTTEYLIWAIARDGALIIGKEHVEEVDGVLEKCGHPSITGFKPARIAGEMWKTPSGWELNSKSGRYRGDYVNSEALLENALNKFRAFFPGENFAVKPPLEGPEAVVGPCAALLKEVCSSKATSEG